MISRFLRNHYYALFVTFMALVAGVFFGWIFWGAGDSVSVPISAGAAASLVVVAVGLFVYAESLDRSPPPLHLSTFR